MIDLYIRTRVKLVTKVVHLHIIYHVTLQTAILILLQWGRPADDNGRRIYDSGTWLTRRTTGDWKETDYK